MDRTTVAEAKAQARAMWGLGDYHRFATETVWSLGPGAGGGMWDQGG